MVNKKREMLENWVYGLFGFEERTFIVIRKLIKDLLDNDLTGFKSEYIDYPDGETYRLDLQIMKIENNEPKKLANEPTITVKIDAEEVLNKIQEEKQKINKYGNWTGCPHFKEE